jgi:hypothetical protein
LAIIFVELAVALHEKKLLDIGGNFLLVRGAG